MRTLWGTKAVALKGALGLYPLPEMQVLHPTLSWLLRLLWPAGGLGVPAQTAEQGSRHGGANSPMQTHPTPIQEPEGSHMLVPKPSESPGRLGNRHRGVDFLQPADAGADSALCTGEGSVPPSTGPSHCSYHRPPHQQEGHLGQARKPRSPGTHHISFWPWLAVHARHTLQEMAERKTTHCVQEMAETPTVCRRGGAQQGQYCPHSGFPKDLLTAVAHRGTLCCQAPGKGRPHTPEGLAGRGEARLALRSPPTGTGAFSAF